MTFSDESNEQHSGSSTGRMIVTFQDKAPVLLGAQAVRKAGIHLVNARELQSGEQAPGMYFEKLGIAVVSCDQDQIDSLCSVGEENSCILAVEPEIICYAISSPEYLQGFKDGVESLIARLQDESLSSPNPSAPNFADTDALTWGLQATNIASSPFTGCGIKLAVLDTGFDLQHPDFINRELIHASFVPNETVQDEHGHGTHCVGTAAGPANPENTARRYGIATTAEIHIGKVLSNAGSGESGWIIGGMNWAIEQGCHIVSMSLGSPAYPGQPYYKYYEVAARRALEQGTLIIAAAGNDSKRHLGIKRPVSHPANCPSIMAVAAIDPDLRVASFSNAGVNDNGGQVDIAAPGVEVYSSWLSQEGSYKVISGTSMATPHVAGIAALHCQASNMRGAELWRLLTTSACRMPLSSSDVGSGLTKAPSAT